MPLHIPSTSKEYLHIGVTGSGTLSSYTVEIAVVAADTEPSTGDWKTAVWDDTDAKVLIGPGTALALGEGLYGAWVRVTTPTEVPVIRSGLIRIT